MYTAASRVDSEKNMAVVTLGVVDIDIPQHPVALHSMMTRSSRTISRHITEIQSQRSVIRYSIQRKYKRQMALSTIFHEKACITNYHMPKSSETYGNHWKSSEIFGNGLKHFFRRFYDFSNSLANLWKSSKVFGNHRKICRRDRNCSETFAGVEKYRS